MSLRPFPYIKCDMPLKRSGIHLRGVRLSADRGMDPARRKHQRCSQPKGKACQKALKTT